MMKQIKLDEDTHKNLSLLKFEQGLKTHKDTIKFLYDYWERQQA